MANEEHFNLKIKIDDAILKGVHATDVMLTINNKDACLTFFVFADAGSKEAIATARVFLPHTTAFQLSDLIQKQIGPLYHQYQDLLKQLPPSSGGTASGA